MYIITTGCNDCTDVKEKETLGLIMRHAYSIISIHSFTHNDKE